MSDEQAAPSDQPTSEGTKTLIFIDSTELCSDPYLSSARWRFLKAARRQWNVEIVTTTVSISETAGRQMRASQDAEEALKKTTRNLGLAGIPSGSLDGVLGAIDKLNHEVFEQSLAKRLANMGFTVLTPDQVSHTETIAKATQRIRPCDNKGDGYRDALNFILYRDYSATQRGSKVIIVTKDTDYRQAPGRDQLHDDLIGDIRTAGMNPDDFSIVVSMEAAVKILNGADGDTLDGIVTKAVTSYLREHLPERLRGEDVSPYLGGLPLEALQGFIVEAENIDRDLKINVVEDGDETHAYVRFEGTMDAWIGMVLEDDSTETVQKVLRFDGYTTWDHAASFETELGKMRAFDTDPGRVLQKRAKADMERARLLSPTVTVGPDGRVSGTISAADLRSEDRLGLAWSTVRAGGPTSRSAYSSLGLSSALAGSGLGSEGGLLGRGALTAMGLGSEERLRAAALGFKGPLGAALGPIGPIGPSSWAALSADPPRRLSEAVISPLGNVTFPQGPLGPGRVVPTSEPKHSEEPDEDIETSPPKT